MRRSLRAAVVLSVALAANANYASAEVKCEIGKNSRPVCVDDKKPIPLKSAEKIEPLKQTERPTAVASLVSNGERREESNTGEGDHQHSGKGNGHDHDEGHHHGHDNGHDHGDDDHPCSSD